MANIVPLRLKVDIDNTAALELAARLKPAIREGLTAAQGADAEGMAGAAAAAVMVEILRVRQATPAEAALARVRALHREEYGCCVECTHESGVPYPCATILTLDGQEP